MLSIIGQIFVVLNEILPKQLIKIDLSLVGLLYAIGTIIFSIVGLVGFGIVYSDYEWWLEAGLYAVIITGVFNRFLFAVKFVSKFVKKN